MRFPALVIVLAACGGSGKTAEPPKQPEPVQAKPAPTPDGKADVFWDESKLGPPPKPVAERPAPPPPKPAPPQVPLYDRLPDTDGAVAGLTGFSTKRVRDPKRCGGQAILTKRAKKVAPTDAKLVEVFALEFPVDLNFTDEKKQAASRLKFQRFIDGMTRTLVSAKTQYEADFASTDPGVKAASAARLAQIYFRAASIFARAEIPMNVRSGDLGEEPVQVYCDALHVHAESMLKIGSDALDACRKFTMAAPAGWWAELCKAP